MSRNELQFKPKARLLLQLGDQLIRNEAIAIFELLKNCYDAYAHYVSIKFVDISEKSKGKIIIEDDGNGMTLQTVTDVWMQPGTDNKKKIFEEKKDYEPKQNEEFRLPLGEKGIGRFGVYKLGNSIELITRAPDCKEVYLKIQWPDLEKIEYLEDVKIIVLERDPEVFLENKKGTQITITNFNQAWTKRRYRETIRLINTLNTPEFLKKLNEKENKKIDVFEVKVEENLSWSDKLFTPQSVIERALFSGEIEINGNNISLFKYDFSPWNKMNGIGARSIVKSDITMFKETRNTKDNKKERDDIDLNKYNIGTVKIFIFAFSLQPQILKLGVTDVRGFKKYVEENGGMKVYRDGLRVYDYGEKSNDWLSMDIRRVNQPGIFLSNNQYMGYIFINRSESSSLIEKSNREGFIENDAYFIFKDAILFAIRQFEIQRNIDKDSLKSYYSSKNYEEPVVKRLAELKELVVEKISEKEVQTRIVQELSRIEEEYDDMIDIFLQSANAGINLGVAIHEIDKVVKELNIILDEKEQIDRAQKLAKRLTGLVNGYAMLLKEKEVKNNNIKTLINQALFNVDFRLQVHNIQLETNLKSRDNVEIECAKNLSIGSIVNLIDNSIWWLEMRQIQKKKIYVGIEEDEKYISVIVADNGSGFDIPPSKAVKPFISSKPAGVGMGLGLYIAKECMEEQGGKIEFPEFDDLNLPKDFKDGAIVMLSFRR